MCDLAARAGMRGDVSVSVLGVGTNLSSSELSSDTATGVASTDGLLLIGSFRIPETSMLAGDREGDLGGSLLKRASV